MSDANYSSIAFQREPSWGTAPGSLALALARITGEGLQHAKETIASEEIRVDRQISDLAQVGASATGNIDFELSYTAYQHWLEAALFGSIVDVSIAETLAINHTTGEVTGSAGDFDDVVSGCYIRIAGASTTANNGIKLVTAKASNGSSITCATGSFTATEASSALTITGKHLKNGTTRHSYLIERSIEASTGTKYYQRFAGMMVDTLSLNVESKQIVTGSMNLLGKIGSTASSASSAYAAAPTDPVLNGTANVGNLRKDNAAMTEKFKSLTLEVANNLRGKDAIGELGNFDIGVGSIEVTGSMQAYFKDNNLLESFIAHGYSSFAMTLTDGLGNTIGIHLPRLNFSTGNPAVTAKDTDVMQPLDFQAILSEAYGATILVSFLDAP